MGSTARLLIGGADDRLVGWAFEELDRLERCWSRFRRDSELAVVNAAAGGWVPVSDTLLDALDRAGELWCATAGVFDPTVLQALLDAGYDRTFEHVRSSDAPVPPARPAPGWPAVVIDRAGRAVRLPGGVGLDLGGLGKGYAADVVAEGLVARGAESALVSLGGDVRVAGVAPAGGWRVPVEDPRPGAAAPFEHVLERGAVVMSTTCIRRWTRGGVPLHHIIDPRTGAPAVSPLAGVAVAADEAWWAEGLAKAALGARRDRRRRAAPPARGPRLAVPGSDRGTVTLALSDQAAWYAARSAGMVAWAAATALILWGLALSTRLIRRRGVPAWLLDLHRFLGTLTLVTVAAHLLVLWADTFVYFGPRELFVPMASDYRPGPVTWGVVATYLLAAIQVTSWAMRRLPRRWWHRVHLSSFAVLVASTVHGFTAGADARNVAVQWAAFTGGLLVFFLVTFRLLAPRKARIAARRAAVAA